MLFFLLNVTCLPSNQMLLYKVTSHPTLISINAYSINKNQYSWHKHLLHLQQKEHERIYQKS
jgi:hypothetical protein